MIRKKQRGEKMKKGTLFFPKTIGFIFSIMLIFIISSGSFASENADRQESALLEVHVLDVGQGLSMVLSCDGHYLLYDGGPGNTSSKVVSYLQKVIPGKLDYIIVSHYDEDHLSGVIGALHVFPVDTLIAPDYQTDTAVFTSFQRAVQENGVPITYASAGQTYDLGAASFQILMPLMPSYIDENDYSVVIRAWLGDTSVIITGDSTLIGEHDMILAQEYLDSDILIAGHHGSSTSSSREFVDAVSPSAAVISCGADNTYGHPSKEVMELLQSYGIPVWRTDMQGDIDFAGDGSDWYYDPAPVNDYSYRVFTEPQDAWEPENIIRETEPEASETIENQPMGASYVLNTNTMKFHYPDCASVYQMNEKNKEYVSAARDEIISWGYSPCGNCHP